MTTAVKILYNDGTSDTMSIKEYNASELTEALNNEQVNYINIGDIITQRYSITRVVPIRDEEVLQSEEV